MADHKKALAKHRKSLAQIECEIKEENKLLKDEIVDKLISWLKHSTIDGVANLALNKSKLARCIWIVSIVAVVSYCCFCITRLVLTYFSYSVLVNMNIAATSLVEFPAVSGVFTNKISISYNLVIEIYNLYLKDNHL